MTEPTTTPAPAEPAKVPYVYRGEGTGLRQRFLWGLGRAISRAVSVLLFRLHVSGQNNLPPAGGVLMVTNHQSFLDPWLIGIGIPRQIHYMARDTLFKGGFLHWAMEATNAFPVRRGAADLTAIRTATERLDKGFVVNIFPEGTRSEDGAIGPIAPGLSIILRRCKTDVVILPVVIDGAFEAWPRSAKFPRPRPIRIFYGRPIPAAQWRALEPNALADLIRRRLVALQHSLASPHAILSDQRLAENM